MKASDYMSGGFISAKDLNQGEDYRATIGGIKEGEYGPQLDLGSLGSLSLNKTNLKRLAQFLGDDMDHWIGKPVVMRRESTHFKGELVPCVRIYSTQDTEVSGAQQDLGSKEVPF